MTFNLFYLFFLKNYLISIEIGHNRLIKAKSYKYQVYNNKNYLKPKIYNYSKKIKNKPKKNNYSKKCEPINICNK